MGRLMGAMALGLAAVAVAVAASQHPALLAQPAALAGAQATGQLPDQAAQQGGRRLALVIGNGAYEDGPLPNAVNDAEDVARTLRSIGFQVSLLKNGDQQAMAKAVEGFRRQLRQGDIGLFYFSGHGVQVAGESFLIPLRFNPAVEANVKHNSLSLNEVVNALEATDASARVLVLDACRNTLPRSWRMSGRNFAARGLASPPDTTGTLIVYATAADKTAADSLAGSRNSPFTTFLVRHLTTPNLEIRELMRRVRRDVVAATSNQQTPYEYGSLIDQVILHPLNGLPAPIQKLLFPKDPIRKQDLPIAPPANPAKRPPNDKPTLTLTRSRRVAEYDGVLTAPGYGAHKYQIVHIDTRDFAKGGTLRIDIQVGNGRSNASFDLFSENAIVPTAGSPGSLAGAHDIGRNSGSSMEYQFFKGEIFQFGAEGNWFSDKGTQSHYSIKAYILQK
jgi:hypothetical protein